MSAEREQRIQERDLTLIPKDFVMSRLFPFLEGLIKRIIEYPDSAVDRIIALAITESETTRIDIVETMIAGLSHIVNNSKDLIITELNSLKSKYQKDIQNHDRIEEIKEAIEEVRNE
jgi:ADP-dependent phosphofructokinase/glucokinase